MPQELFEQIEEEAGKKDIKPRDDEELRATRRTLGLQIKGLIARDLWDMSEYFHVVNESSPAVKQALIAAIAREPGQGEVALDLLMIAKYFERIGDHAVNLSEWVEFSVTGVHKHDGVEYE